MTIEVRHKFVSQKADVADDSLIRPSNWNDTHDIFISGPSLIGRADIGQGEVSEIILGEGLIFDSGALAVDPFALGAAAEVAFFARNTPPNGWLKANGAAVSRTTYAVLFDAIGTVFGEGNGTTTFNLPDLRGEFPRGWSDGRSIDSGRNFGSTQSSQNLQHNHSGSSGNSGNHSHSGSSGNDGGHGHTAWSGGNSVGNSPHGYTRSTNQSRVSSNSVIDSVGNHRHSISIGSNGNHNHSISIGNDGGNEARPRNVALLACIKF